MASGVKLRRNFKVFDKEYFCKTCYFVDYLFNLNPDIDL